MTFRPKKKFEPGTLRYSLHKQAQASLSSGINLRTAVQLPPGEEANDWIAVHDVPFPKTFQSLCRKILTRLFRVFVHVYIHHFDRIVAIGAEPHVNTCYKHFYYFVREFDLVGPKELEPLQEMTSRICKDVAIPSSAISSSHSQCASSSGLPPLPPPHSPSHMGAR
ncbi:hypothetical protein B566_EDAN003570 [Ephemera danica]|nr:hypothetical protein B566_EDAN003570 [Ephemera danica]